MLLLGFGQSALEFEASVWMRDPWNHRVAASTLREAIWLAFKDEKIAIAYPQIDVHLDQPLAESLRALSGGEAPNAA